MIMNTHRIKETGFSVLKILAIIIPVIVILMALSIPQIKALNEFKVGSPYPAEFYVANLGMTMVIIIVLILLNKYLCRQKNT